MYTVIENTPGYLPEDDSPGVFETLQEARLSLKDEVERYCDNLAEFNEPYSANWSDDGLYCHVVQSEHEHDLGRVFEILSEQEQDSGRMFIKDEEGGELAGA